MHTTKKLCAAVMRERNITTAYALAKIFSTTSQTAHGWVTGKHAFGNAMALKCARLLSLNPAYCLACANWEREKDPTAKQAWKIIAETCPDIDEQLKALEKTAA